MDLFGKQWGCAKSGATAGMQTLVQPFCLNLTHLARRAAEPPHPVGELGALWLQAPLASPQSCESRPHIYRFRQMQTKSSLFFFFFLSTAPILSVSNQEYRYLRLSYALE